MDGKKLKRGSESHKFVEKLFTRLKMTKHANDDKVAEAKKIDSPTSGENNLTIWNCNKINAENIMEFSDQLQQLLEHLQEMKEFTFYTYDYPNQLNNKLEKEAMELRSLFRDVRAAAIDIDRLKKQRNILKKEKAQTQKKLDKLREEEMKELESIINVYAKPLFCKWESIKNTQKPEVLENFMNEVTGKYTAMEILRELITRKLTKLVKKQSSTNTFSLKRNNSSSNIISKLKSQDRTISSWNITNMQEVVKIPPQTPDKSSKTSTERDVIRVNRRKRQRESREDRRKQILDSVTTVSNNSSSVSESGNAGLNLQLVPIVDNFVNDESDEPTPSRVSGTSSNSMRFPPTINVEYASDDDSLSLSRSDLIIENFVRTANTDIQPDLQNDMRNVLQAIFGEIRQFPQLSYNGRTMQNGGNDLRSSRTSSH